MAERAVADGRDTLAKALRKYGVLDDLRARWTADRLVDGGHVRIVDPTDPALVERVATAIAAADVAAGYELSWGEVSRAAIRAVFGDQ